MKIKFQNQCHYKKFHALLARMKSSDCYHSSAAYLMALANLVPEDVFDFTNDIIRQSGVYAPWQTSSSLKATRLMFNLWNDWAYDEDFIPGDNLIPSVNYAVGYIFDNWEYAPYFIEAIRLRFGYD